MTSKATNVDVKFQIVDNIRYVVPYIHEFTTYAKGRWLGRPIKTLLCEEYGAHPNEYWERAIKYGHVRINNRLVDEDYRFKSGDFMLHRTHRHEPPIQGVIELVGETEEVIAVNKPASMATHPCGSYRRNTLTFILSNEPLIENQPHLHLIHRLDRVTSGLMILAKSKEVASALSQSIRDRATTKIYLARVKGMFPKNLEFLKLRSFEEIRNIGEVDDEDDDEEGTSSKKKKRKLNEMSAHENPKSTPLEEIFNSPEVGYHIDEATGELYLRCPIGVLDYRQGIHSCQVNGKPSLSSFTALGYCSDTDTTLVKCHLHTGRTHQLRLHLQFLGNPIANDPCHGGELFYRDTERRSKALRTLKAMKRRGYIALAKVPHFNQDEIDAFKDEEEDEDSSVSSSSALVDSTRLENETDDEYLQRTCRYCQGKSYELETILHCDGIWLHALRYENHDKKFCFETSWPPWAESFRAQVDQSPLTKPST